MRRTVVYSFVGLLGNDYTIDYALSALEIKKKNATINYKSMSTNRLNDRMPRLQH